MACIYLSLFFGLLSLILDQGPIYSLLWWIGIEPAIFLWGLGWLAGLFLCSAVFMWRLSRRWRDDV